MNGQELQKLASDLAAGKLAQALTQYDDLVETMKSGRFALYYARELLRRGRITAAVEVLDAAIEEEEHGTDSARVKRRV